jgi:prepilin-type N-terminal cleavage/methylation domain-containing protein
MGPTSRYQMGKCMLGRAKSGQGYTLIEVMVVIAIIAALAAVAVPNYSTWQQRAQLKSDVGNLAGNLGRARMSAINQNISVNVIICHQTPVCPGALANTTPAQVTVFFQNAATGAPIAGLSQITMNAVVSLSDVNGNLVGAGLVASPQVVGFSPMGLWVNTGIAANTCTNPIAPVTPCPAGQAAQVLNFVNRNAVNHRIVILPTGKVAWCYTGNCTN